MIAVIDYGLGNLASIKNMIRKAGYDAVITNKIDEIVLAEKLILPGVGSFDTGMLNIRKLGLTDIIREMVIGKKIPVMGICLGMQLMCERSEEGSEPGFGFVRADVKIFDVSKFTSNERIPHVGWDYVRNHNKESLLFKEMYPDPRFYFTHSYHVVLNENISFITARHGYEFIAGIEKNNITGVQFHPEKSHKFGMKLLQNFIMNY